MSDPKMKPCPKCGRADLLEAFAYRRWWHQVECTSRICDYAGPDGRSKRAAILAHNERVEQQKAAAT